MLNTGRISTQALHLLVAGVLIAMIGFASSAFAQSGQDIKKAAKRFEEAESFYKLQKYEDALKGYEEAYLLSKEPALLFNIGQCYRQLGRCEEASKSYKTFLREIPESEMAPKIDELIAECEPKKIETPTSEPQIGTPTGEAGGLSYKTFYGVAAGGASVGLVLGGVAVFEHIKGLQLVGVDGVEAARRFKLAGDFAISAAIVGAISVGAGIAGYTLSPRKKAEPKTSLVLSVAPFGLALSGEWAQVPLAGGEYGRRHR